MWCQLSTTCSNVLKQPTGELLVVVNHNQLWTMASETVNPIDWSHSPPSWAVPPERHVHSINQCNLSGNRMCNSSMRGNHFAYAATQGINVPWVCVKQFSFTHNVREGTTSILDRAYQPATTATAAVVFGGSYYRHLQRFLTYHLIKSDCICRYYNIISL